MLCSIHNWMMIIVRSHQCKINDSPLLNSIMMNDVYFYIYVRFMSKWWWVGWTKTKRIRWQKCYPWSHSWEWWPLWIWWQIKGIFHVWNLEASSPFNGSALSLHFYSIFNLLFDDHWNISFLWRIKLSHASEGRGNLKPVHVVEEFWINNWGGPENISFYILFWIQYSPTLKIMIAQKFC